MCAAVAVETPVSEDILKNACAVEESAANLTNEIDLQPLEEALEGEGEKKKRKRRKKKKKSG